MVRTRVGYAGGSTPAPTYHDLADHTEVFQIDFDPTLVTYEEIVDTIWRHRRGGRDYGRHQYMEAIFATPAQADIANRLGKVPVIVGAAFHLAEDYHQKYRLRRDATLMRELQHLTPRQFVDSTAAARLNAIVARHKAPIPGGLSPEARRYVERLLSA